MRYFNLILFSFVLFASSFAAAHISTLAGATGKKIPLISVYWAGWDGTEDGTEGHFYDDGGAGPPASDVINATDFLVTVRDRNAAPEKRYVYKKRRVGKDVVTLGRVELSVNTGVGSNVAVFNDSYAFVMFHDNTYQNHFLLDISGDIPVELDYVDATATEAAPSCKGGSTRVSSDYVALWCPDANKETYLVGRSGDQLEYSPAAAISGASGNTFAFGWDDDTYIGLTTEDFFAFNITDINSAPTQAATIDINTVTSFAYTAIHGAFKAYDDRIVVIGQTSASTDYLGCEVVSFDGTSFTREFSNNQLVTGVLYWINPPIGKVGKLDTSTAMLVGTDVNGANAYTRTEGRIITLSSGDTCEIGAPIDLIGADHIVINNLAGDNNRYAVVLGQDPNTTPADKISYKIIDGKGEAPASGGGGGSCTAMTGASLDISFSCPDSYAGTGTTVTDLAGNTNFTIQGDPTFSTGYLEVDGTGDYLLADTIPDTDIHKVTGGDFLAAFLIETPATTMTSIAYEFDVSSQTDDFLAMGFFTSNGDIKVRHRASSTFFNGNVATTAAAVSTVYCLVQVMNQTTYATTWYINSTTADTVDDGTDFAYNSPPDIDTFAIGADGTGANAFGAGTKIYEARFDFDITAENVTGTDIQEIYDTWNARVGSNICPTS